MIRCFVLCSCTQLEVAEYNFVFKFRLNQQIDGPSTNIIETAVVVR
jgi:hypothetical protein